MLSLQRKPSDAYEFKPILAEIEEEPVSPLARTTLWIVVGIIVFFITWSIVGEVDIVVTAPGKVIPRGHAKVLQPLDSGVIAKILVHEGDKVRKGQALMEIDPSVTADELESTNRNYRYTRLEIDRLQSTLSGTPFLGTHGVDQQSAMAQRELYESSRSALMKQLESKRQELEKTTEEQKQTEAELGKNKELLTTALAKRERLAPVMDIIPRDDWDKNENDVTTYTANIDQGKHKLDELTHARSQLQSDLEKINFDFQTTNLQDLSQKQKDATELDGKVRELTFKHSKQTLVSPVDGYVDAVYAHTVGGVVSPAEKLMSIVPDDTEMVVQASVSNKDIGFVSQGMPAQLKIDTFDFQKYGMFSGKVLLVSKDSHDDEAKKAGAGEQTQTEKKLEQVYEVYIQPTTKSLKVEGKEQPLVPGMTLSAEIKVGKRHIIEFFIYPLIKYWHDGITVR